MRLRDRFKSVISHDAGELPALRLRRGRNEAADDGDVGEIRPPGEIMGELIKRHADGPLHAARPGDGSAIFWQHRYLLVPEMQTGHAIARADERAVAQCQFVRRAGDVETENTGR